MQMLACVPSPVCRTPSASPHPLVPGDATILTKNLLYDIRTDTDVTWMGCATESQVERCLRRLGTELREALTTTYVDAESCTDYWRRTSDDGTHRLGDRLILSVAMAWAVYMVGERRLVLRVDRIDPLDAGAFDGLVARHLLRTQVTCRQPEGIVAGVEADRERLEQMLAGFGSERNGTRDDLVCSLFAAWVLEGVGEGIEFLDGLSGGLWGDHTASPLLPSDVVPVIGSVEGARAQDRQDLAAAELEAA